MVVGAKSFCDGIEVGEELSPPSFENIRLLVLYLFEFLGKVLRECFCLPYCFCKLNMLLIAFYCNLNVFVEVILLLDKAVKLGFEPFLKLI